jgi:hypothetical protein
MDIEHKKQVFERTRLWLYQRRDFRQIQLESRAPAALAINQHIATGLAIN